MNRTYQTARYEVRNIEETKDWAVTDLRGKCLRSCPTFESACELADLYQADDDYEEARERWDSERGLEP
jgi:hypothetical protein